MAPYSVSSCHAPCQLAHYYDDFDDDFDDFGDDGAGAGDADNMSPHPPHSQHVTVPLCRQPY